MENNRWEESSIDFSPAQTVTEGAEEVKAKTTGGDTA